MASFRQRFPRVKIGKHCIIAQGVEIGKDTVVKNYVEIRKGVKIGETFEKFAQVAEKNGVYTPADYTDIMDHLLKTWDIANLTGLGDKAEAAQQYLCSLPDRYRKVAERFGNRIQEADYKFSWLEMVEAEPKPLVSI